MKLSEFILSHMEEILTEWESFAATLLPAARDLDAIALRDHAREILEAIAKDLTTAQTRDEQSAKSRGLSQTEDGAPETAAQTHAVLRARGGFDVNQLVAEYRALRASVLRLWADSKPLDKSSIEEMTRFNEAIDQAVAESVSHFHRSVERYRHLLLGMLGHDMRNPLASITMTAKYLAQLNAGDKVSDAAHRLIRSGAAMQALLDDLTDFNRTSLGMGLKVRPIEIDLAKNASDELEQLRTAHPDQRIEFNVTGDMRGHWDGARVQQVIRNLVTNAIRYGSPNLPVRVTLRGETPEVHLEVSNDGYLDPDEARRIFEPMHRGAVADTTVAHDGLGLGLFIVREIVKAHGGEVDAHSKGNETIFAVHLPRQSPAPDAPPQP